MESFPDWKSINRWKLASGASAVVILSVVVFFCVTSVHPLPPLAIRHPLLGRILRDLPLAVPILWLGATLFLLRRGFLNWEPSQAETRHNEMLSKSAKDYKRVFVGGAKGYR
jgi:hypothetical protein